MTDKPPYRIPSVQEIRDVPDNGLTAVSTFSGAGGGCLGLRWAGWKVAWASEFIPEARDTYRANMPYTPVDDRDIRLVKGSEILDAIGLDVGELDLLEGSPPCSDFSTAGKRQEGWGKTKHYSNTQQRVDDLFFEYVRLLDELQPRTFYAENVPGLSIGVAKGYLREIMTAMRAVGYNVAAKILDASLLGVPQARRRLIFVGTRNDLDIPPPFPKPFPYRYTIADALPWLENVIHDTRGLFGQGPVLDRPSPTITVGVNSVNSLHYIALGDHPFEDLPLEEQGAPIDGYAIGREWKILNPGEQSDRYFQLVKPHPNEPAPTITQTAGIAGAAGITHPYEPRKFSIPELRRLCGFPDDFVLTGTYRQRWERLGRAVPPPMSKAIGLALEEALT